MKKALILIFLFLPSIVLAGSLQNKLSIDSFICKQMDDRYRQDKNSVDLIKFTDTCAKAAWANIDNFHNGGGDKFLDIAIGYVLLPLQYENTLVTYKLYDSLGAANTAKLDFRSAERSYKQAKLLLKNRPDQFDIYINHAINSQSSLLKSFHGIGWGSSAKSDKNLKFKNDMFLGKSYGLLNDMDSFLHYDTGDIKFIFKDDKFYYVTFYISKINTVAKFEDFKSKIAKFYNIKQIEEIPMEQLIGSKFILKDGSNSVVMQLFFGMLEGSNTTLVQIYKEY